MNKHEIAKNVLKITKDTINNVDIKLPKIHIKKEIWIGNYCIKIKTQ